MKAKQKCLQAIEKKGALLVFPINNKKNPPSLWSELHPRTEMVWEWDSGGDNWVSELWHLREELSKSGLVVYTKWYQGRATFFSRSIFVALLAYLQTPTVGEISLSRESRLILETLQMDSPLSTRQIKEAVDLRGKFLEAQYNRAMKALWNRLLIVAFGEVADSSFPSLAVGATALLFEDLWSEAQALGNEIAEKRLVRALGRDSLFLKFANRVYTYREANLGKGFQSGVRR